MTSVHRDAFKKVVLAFSAELSAVMAEMPDHLCDDYRSRMVAIVQWQLSAQSEFYSNRERWIAAATEICERIESRRESVTFSEQGVHFAGDGDLDRFMRLMGVIEGSHQLEVARLQERLNRLAQSATILGFRFVW